MGSLSVSHILVIAAVLVILFGGGRISAIMANVAKGIRGAKREMRVADL